MPSRRSGVAGALLAAACGLGHGSYEPRGTPLTRARVTGLDFLLPAPLENPLTVEGVALGERLFFDPVLSADGAVRCATCHRPEHSFSDTVAVSRGVYGRLGRRNAPAIINRGYGRSFFWDGRSKSLEDQVLHPVLDSIEMGQSLQPLIQRLRTDAGYARDFGRTFGRIDSTAIARALASYVRIVRSGNAPFDRWREGDTTALSPAARRGLALFIGRANCVVCHVGPNFTDEDFHNTGVAARSARFTAVMDSGRGRITRRAEDVGAFKTPTLREVARTAPFMHDGSLATLDEVVAFYDSGGVANPHLDADLVALRLTSGERRDLVAFLQALNGTIIIPGGNHERLRKP